MSNRKAAIELSIGTIVIIVISMSMLILGLVLVRSIFTGATESVDTLNDRVKSEITSLFAREGSKVVVLLGSDRTATITAGDSIGIGIGAKAPDDLGALQRRDDLEFRLELESEADAPSNCLALNGNAVYDWFDYTFVGDKTNLVSFDEFDGRDALAIIRVDVPDTTQPCAQKVFVDVVNRAGGNSGAYAGSSFIIEVEEGGIFN